MAHFEEMLDEFANALREYGLQRLAGERLLGFLQSFVSADDGEGREVAVPAGQLLDGYLPDCALNVGREHLILEGVRRRVVAAVSVKAFPGGADDGEEHAVKPRSYPGMLDGLLKVPGEITFSQVFRFCDLEQAGRFIRAKRRFNDVFKYNWQAFFRGVLRKGDMSGANANPVRERGVKEATEALGLLETQKAFFGFWNMSVLCYGDTPGGSGRGGPCGEPRRELCALHPHPRAPASALRLHRDAARHVGRAGALVLHLRRQSRGFLPGALDRAGVAGE